MNQTDLRVHSEYSNDGEFEIREIVDTCIANNVGTLSITDHNSVLAIAQAIHICSDSDINFIPGIEIDCSYKEIDLHLLGYNIDWRSQDFAELENSVRRNVMDSFPEMVENLEKAGIKVDKNEVLEKAREKLPYGKLYRGFESRPHRL